MYQTFTPPPILQPFIHSYWRLYSSAYRVEQSMVVDAYADLIFSYGIGYERRRLDTPSSVQSLTVSNLDAQRDYPLTIIQEGAVNLVGVRFRPGGLAAFTSVPVHEFSNQTPDLYNTFGAQALILENQLFDAPDTSQQIALLNHFFLRRLNLSASHSFSLAIAQQIEQQRGAVAMRDLSADVGYSIRTVDRLFRQYFGISPKFYARIVRFRQALLLLAKSHLSLTDIAFACGYYDLAHFSKECSALSGLSAEACRQFILSKTQVPPPLADFVSEQNI